MAEFIFPGSDFDEPERLLTLLGSFWCRTYQGDNLVRETAHSRAQLDAESHRQMLELLASCSRFEIPVFHKENWYFFTFLESEVNSANVYEYDGEITYDATANYDDPKLSVYYSVTLPEGVHDVRMIMNRISDPSVTLAKNLDFWVEDGVVTFRDNPFSNSLVPIQEVFTDGVVTDRQAGLWLFRSEWDWENVYEQFGYALKMKMESSEGYKELLNAILDGIIRGTSSRDLQFAWSAITGVPLACEATETVELRVDDMSALVIVTDQHVYRFPKDSVPLVDSSDVVRAGDPLVDTLQFFDLNSGAVPAELDALVVGPGLLDNSYYGELVFNNEDVTLVTTTDANDRVKASFEIEGFPGDVEQFFDDVHERGIARGKTLAQILDPRPNPTGEPPAGALPETINPLEFMVENFFRYHMFVVKIRPGLMGQAKLGLAAATHLQRLVPPQTVMLVIVELEYADEAITMDGSGSETRPGYTEQVSGFPCMVGSEIIHGPTMVTERLRLYQIRGKCQ